MSSQLFVDDRQQKLRFISRLAEAISLAAMALIVAYCGWLGCTPRALTVYLQRDVPGVLTPPSHDALMLAYALSLIPAAIFVAAMWEARVLFRLFRASRIFDPAAPRQLLRLGVVAIAAALAGVTCRTLVVLTMTSSNPPGQRQLVFGIGSNEIASLIIGLLLFAFALVMQEAMLIEEDNLRIL